MDDRLVGLVEGLEAVGHDPDSIRDYAARIPVGDVVDLAEAGYLAVEQLGNVSEGLAATVADVLRQRHRDQATPDAEVRVVCLAGIDDPEAAVKVLQGKAKEPPVWRVEDGYLYVDGATEADVVAALQATRP